MLGDNDEAYEELALDFTATGGARSVLRLVVDADYIALVDVSTDVLEVSVNDGSFRRLRLGAVIRPRQPLRKIAVRNPSGGVVTGTLAYGKGSYIDNRVIVASGGGGTLPVGSADGALISLGATTDAAAATDTGNASLIALVKRLLQETPALGSALSAASTPVVIASDQAAVLTTLATVANYVSGVSPACAGVNGEATVIAAQGAGVKMYITTIELGNDSATGSDYEIRAGAGGTVLFAGRASAANGRSITFPMPLQVPANTALVVRQILGATIRVAAVGYKGT